MTPSETHDFIYPCFSDNLVLHISLVCNCIVIINFFVFTFVGVCLSLGEQDIGDSACAHVLRHKMEVVQLASKALRSPHPYDPSYEGEHTIRQNDAVVHMRAYLRRQEGEVCCSVR